MRPAPLGAVLGASLLWLAVGGFALLKLWPIVLMLIIAILLSVMLDPIVVRLARRGVREGLSIAMIAGAMLLLDARTKTLEDTALTLIALTSGGLLGLYLLGFLTRRGDGRSAGLAIAAATELSSAFEANVAFVDLSMAPGAADVVPILARSLGLHDIGSRARLDRISNLISTGSSTEVKGMLTRLIDFLKSDEVTAMFTCLTFGDGSIEGTDVGISSLMDTWILLRSLEHNGERNRALLDEVCERRVDFAFDAGLEDMKRQPFRTRSCQRFLRHALGTRSIVRVHQQRDRSSLGN